MDGSIEDKEVFVISKKLPLISNLSVLENCSLLLEYHEGISSSEAARVVSQKLELMGMEGCGEKREPHLNEYERFVAMFVRASMLKGSIVIDRPFMLVENGREEFLQSVLERMKPVYTNVRIIDYIWNRHRYGGFNVQES